MSETTTQSAMKQMDELSASMSDPMVQLTQVLPFMIRKHEVGKMYYGKYTDNEERNICMEQIRYYNDCIKKVMGIVH